MILDSVIIIIAINIIILGMTKE